MSSPVPQQDYSQNELDMVSSSLAWFLATAPSHLPIQPLSPHQVDVTLYKPNFHQMLLPSGQRISCIQLGKLHYITGTDVMRILLFRYSTLGRSVIDHKKFEEGVFSDLRNLRPGNGAVLLESRSQLLQELLEHDCIRTQKRQKIFCWFSVNHDRLLADALEREVRRNLLGKRTLAQPASLLCESQGVQSAPPDPLSAQASALDPRLTYAEPTPALAEAGSSVTHASDSNSTHTCCYPGCSRVFKRLEHLRRHSRMHSDARPFVCTICKKSFSRSDNMATHIKVHSKNFARNNVDMSLIIAAYPTTMPIMEPLLANAAFTHTTGNTTMILQPSNISSTLEQPAGISSSSGRIFINPPISRGQFDLDILV